MNRFVDFVLPYALVAVFVIVALFGLTVATVGYGHELSCLKDGATAFEYLEKRHGETVAVQGVTNTGWAFFVATNPETLSWTAFAINPQNGFACMIDSGDGLELIEPKVPGRDS